MRNKIKNLLLTFVNKYVLLPRTHFLELMDKKQILKNGDKLTRKNTENRLKSAQNAKISKKKIFFQKKSIFLKNEKQNQ